MKTTGQITARAACVVEDILHSINTRMNLPDVPLNVEVMVHTQRLDGNGMVSSELVREEIDEAFDWATNHTKYVSILDNFTEF